MDGAARYQAEAIKPPTTQEEAQPRGIKLVEANFIPPPAPPAAPPTSPLSDQTPAPALTSATPLPAQAARASQPSSNNESTARETFAEFERTIPLSSTNSTRKPEPRVEDDVIIVDPKLEPAAPQSLPVIIPAGTSAPAIEPAVPRSLPPIEAKELPDVTDTTNPTSDLPPANLDQLSRPRDVAVLVEQVFEDLRQRRLDHARQRTSWLKQVVTRRESALDENSAAKPVGVAAEPRRLRVDQHALPVDQAPSEKLLDDDESLNRP
jgi:hypothetical protein